MIGLETNPKVQRGHAEAPVAANPKNLAALEILIEVLQKSGDAVPLEAALVRAFRIEPDDPQVSAKLALLRASAGETEEADKLLAHAVKLAPWNPRVLGLCAVTAASDFRFYGAYTNTPLRSSVALMETRPSLVSLKEVALNW